MALIDVERLKRSGQKFASGFTPGQKVISVLGVVGVVLAGTMFLKWSSTPSYAPLFSNLSGKDAGDITNALDGMGVKYQLADGGKTVMVPQSQLYKTRVDLSAKGLPANSDSFALLDNAGITTSEFVQNVDYQRAVQAELSKTLEAIHGVNAATVNLTMPSDDPFVGADGQKATAAVQLDTGGVRIGSEQVQSIVHLVASSVKNLSPDGVTVTDTSGNLLYAPGSDDAFANSQNLSRTLAFESAKKAQIEDMLAKSLGPGHATVTVSADIDYAKGQTKRTTVTPVVDPKTGKQLVASDNSDVTKYTAPPSSNAGVLGIDGKPLATSNNGPTTYSDEKHQVSNLVDSESTTADSPGGTIKRLTASVALDQRAVPAGAVRTYQNLIATALGIDATRKDALTVQRVPMDKQTVALAKKQFENATNPSSPTTPLDMLGMLRYVVTLLIVAIVLFLAWRSIKRAQLALGPMRVPLEYAALEAAGVGALGAAYAGELAATLGHELPAAEPRALEPARTSVEHDVVDLIERQPEDVAQTLRSWLADRRG
jgi:flagellar M-ring protein FliF